MPEAVIPESTFLLTELKYTLGQLHVQVLDLDEATRKSTLCGDRSIEQILQEMLQYEGEYQAKYRGLLHASTSTQAEDIPVPLPVNAGEEVPSQENSFEHKRAQTIALLETAQGDWPPELLDLAREHVTQDRRHTTDLAECRKAYLHQEQRPDLNEPLTVQ